MIEKSDYLEIDRILRLTRFKKEDVQSLEDMMRKYVDPKCRVCTKCRSQIRFTLKRLQKWFYHQEMKQDVKLCQECGKELTDKRRKTCQECKESKENGTSES